MRKIKLLLCALLFSVGAGAQSLDYITFKTVDGNETSLPIDGLKITFEGQQLHAVAQQQKVDFPLNALSSLFFTATPTAIENVTAATGAVAIVNGKLQVDVPAGTPVEVYTLDGRRVDAGSQLNGLYIVKVQGKTYKLMGK